MWGSESKHAVEELPEERKSLALRYTVDPAEAQRHDRLATQTSAVQEERTRRANAANRETVSPRPATAGSTAAPPQPCGRVPSLKERLGKMLNRQESAAVDVRTRWRAGEPQSRHPCCARCGRECSREKENWTLRLCGDDQLHPVCRDCDERDFSDASGVARTSSWRRVPSLDHP